MRKKITGAAALIILSLSFANFRAGVYAGRIELDNGTIANASQPFLVMQKPDQFSRFSAGGSLENQGFAPGPCDRSTNTICGPTRVYTYQLSDYGINSANLSQVGSLLQLQIQFQTFLGGSGSVRVFLRDPNAPTTPIFLPQTLSVMIPTGSTGITTLFNLSDFGALPFNISPDFYIGVTGTIATGSTSTLGFGSLSILSTVPAGAPVPEPTTLSLLLSGLAGSGIIWRRRRRKKSEAP